MHAQVDLPLDAIQARSQKISTGGFFWTKCGPFWQNSGPFYKSVDLFYKIEDIFNKIVDLLFTEGGSSAPREPPLATGLLW